MAAFIHYTLKCSSKLHHFLLLSIILQIAKLARDLKKQLNIGFDSPSHMPPLVSSGAADSSATSTATAAASTSTATTTTGLRTVTSAREGRLDSSGQC